MKNNSKKQEGFGLIEVVISMALIAIISIGVYNGYILIINQIKNGELKQQSALIGRKIAEDIKSIYKDTDIEKKDGKLKLGTIYLTNNEGNSMMYSGIFNVDKNGQFIDNDEGNNSNESVKAKYEAEVTMKPKNTITRIDEKNQEEKVEIPNFSDSIGGYKAYIIRSDSETEISDNDVKGNNITKDVELFIDTTEENRLLLNIGQSEVYYDVFDKENNKVSLDLKYCKKQVKIEVNNKTKTPLNLYILNSDSASVDVVNQNGVLNEYYRSENDNIVGVLYEIRIKVYDKYDKDKKVLYEANFVQNVDIK